MNQTLRMLVFTFALPVVMTACKQKAAEDQSRSPFGSYSQASKQVFVFDPSLFRQYTGPSVERSNVPEYEVRRRIGVVTLAPKIDVYVDRIDYLVHGPSSFELTDVSTGALLAKFDLGLIAPDLSGKLLFNGQGTVYLNHVPTSVCYGYATRKFTLSGRKLVETKQAIVYLGADAEVFGEVQLHSTFDGAGSVVAALQDGAKVTVIGIAPDSVVLAPKSNRSLPNLLVKTPLGLTGWFVPRLSTAERAGITIAQCN